MPWTTVDGRTCRRCGESADRYFYVRPSGGNPGRVCRTCSQDKDGRDRQPKNLDGSPNRTPDGRTLVTNSCGHTYGYRIKNPSAVQWLERRPCPKCAQRDGTPNDGTPDQMPNDDPTPEPTPEPTPDPTPDPDTSWVDEMLTRIPDGLFHGALVDVISILGAARPTGVWLQGPPGTAKSTVATQVADALNLTLYPLAAHEFMSRSDLFGSEFNGNTNRTPLWDAFEYGGLFLLDEIDNGNPNLTAALNSALSNGFAVFGGGTVVQRHENFRVIATANTAGLGPENGYIGRNGVDLATRDRFVTVSMPIDELHELGLALLVAGDDVSDVVTRQRDAARKLLNRRSVNLQQLPDVELIVSTVRKIRQVVESRFRGTLVISPRCTLDTVTLTRIGFTLGEALATKLPGLNATEVEQLLSDVDVP